MSQAVEFERIRRRKLVSYAFALLTMVITGLLVFKLRALVLPIVVGALLAYLFRPLKDRFQIKFLPHELRVITLFACVGLCIYGLAYQVKRMVPDEKGEIELKVRLKYKLNEKLQEFFATKSAAASVVARESGSAVAKINALLNLSPEEVDLFQKYELGYKNQPPIDSRFVEYFKANQTKSQQSEAGEGEKLKSASPDDGSQAREGLLEELSIWILAPLIFIFLGFDHGQMRRYFIGLVPNRYFELSLTVMDELDDAIGRYLRGTLMECGLVGASLAVGLFLLGLPFGVALAIGVILGLANAIPFLGPVIGLVIAIGYSLIAETITPLIPGLNPADLVFYVVVLIGLVHLLDNVVFQPIVLGGAVNLHPLVVAIAIISGSVMMGVWGMLLAIPTVVIVKTAVEKLYKELKAYRII